MSRYTTKLNIEFMENPFSFNDNFFEAITTFVRILITGLILNMK